MGTQKANNIIIILRMGASVIIKLQKEGTLRRQMAFGRKEALKLEHSAALCWKYLLLPNYFPNNLPLVFYFPHLSLHDFFYIRC